VFKKVNDKISFIFKKHAQKEEKKEEKKEE